MEHQVVRFCFAVLLFFIPPLVASRADEVVVEPPQPEESVRLQGVLHDDFKTDSRSEYTIVGETRWEPGTLTIPEGSSLERTGLNAPTVELSLDIGFSSLSEQNPNSELRLWFTLRGATNCYLRVRRSLRDGAPAASIALVDTESSGGFLGIGARLKHIPVRETELSSADVNRLSIRYRHGLVVVDPGFGDQHGFYVDNRDADITGVMLQASTSDVVLRSFRTAIHAEEPVDLTADEQRQLQASNLKSARLAELSRQGKYSHAAEIGEQVCADREKLLGSQHLKYAASLHDLGLQYQHLGRFSDADSAYRRALAIREAALGKNHPRYLATLNNRSGLLADQGDYPEAMKRFEDVLRAYEFALGDQHPDYAAALNNMAASYEKMGQFEKAERAIRKSLRIRRAHHGDDHPMFAVSLNSLAILRVKLGDFEQAVPMFKSVNAIVGTKLGESHPYYATSLGSLAGLYQRMGAYEQAEPLYNRVLTLLSKSPGRNQGAYASCLSGLAGLYDSMGDPQKAEPLYRKALDLRKAALNENHPTIATSLNNLGLFYISTGDFTNAETLLREALRIRRNVFGENHPDVSVSLNNLALLEYSRRDLRKAESLFHQALNIRVAAVGEDHHSCATCLNNLGAVNMEIGRFARAGEFHERASTVWEAALGEGHPNVATCLNNHGQSLYHLKDFHSAGELFSKSESLARELLDRSAAVQSERQQKSFQVRQRSHLGWLIANACQADVDVEQVLESVWKWKGSVTLRQQAFREASERPELAPIFKNLQEVSRQLSATATRFPKPPPARIHSSALELYRKKKSHWDEQIRMLTESREGLEKQLAAASVRFRELNEPLTVKVFQRLLPPRTAFIDFLEYRHPVSSASTDSGERRLIGFVVQPDRKPVMIEFGTMQELSDRISTFRRQFETAPESREVREAATRSAHALRQQLWVPIEEHLEDIQTVVISPDTILGMLPFAALPSEPERNDTYLLEKYRFASLPIAGILRQLHSNTARPPSKPGSLLLIGSVDYDHSDSAKNGSESPDSSDSPSGVLPGNAEGKRWKTLAGFKDEMTAIQQLHAKNSSDTDIVTGRAATEEAFLAKAPACQTLHLITHGFFADPHVRSIDQAEVKNEFASQVAAQSDPFVNTHLPGLLSGLALAGANSPSVDPADPRDGILRASEIEASSLDGVDLVVLSACETGLGMVAGGEGLTGLQRAFEVAGARTVIASLWRVDDSATTALMKRFYTNLWEKKMSKLDALREAQLAMLYHYDAATGQLRGLGGNKVRVDPAKPVPKSDNSERLDPRYWAAFQLSGDWR